VIRFGFLASVQRLLLAILLIVVLTVISLTVHAYWTWRRYVDDSMPEASVLNNSPPTAAPGGAGGALSSSGNVSPQDKPLIGIVAGHWDSDSGAVCPDGLTEGEINLDVAERVFSLLSRAGYQVEMLPEFSDKLNGYQAAALVSIHTDSCNVPEATGFKVARVSSSMVPEVEDRLVACLIEHYKRTTGLAVHQNSITFDMTEYHAFFEIAPDTPAAIIEIGFMAADRSLLTRRPDLIARGIYEGIVCFVEPEE
jgi:N-acetylmuramoyl-L-alanine amidase